MIKNYYINLLEIYYIQNFILKNDIEEIIVIERVTL